LKKVGWLPAFFMPTCIILSLKTRDLSIFLIALSMPRSVSFEFAELEYANRILKVRIKEGIELTVEILQAVLETGAELAQGQKFAILSDLRADVSSTAEARAYGAKNKFMSQHIAYALIANSTAGILLTNFFIRVNKPTVTSRLFKNEEDAFAWIQSILQTQ